MPADIARPSPFRAVSRLRDFRRLFAGVTTSQLGDQFALVATPWLVLQLTGDPLALGIVLALEGAPRAIFMLVGGAVTDRLSPRITMLICDVIRLALAGLMAALVLSGGTQMWMVYAFALAVGLVGGFAVPAGNSIVPTVVEKKDLEAGNAMVMGGGQLAGFIGPVSAGILLGSFTNSLTGVGVAFLIDALTFAFSALMLWQMRSGSTVTPSRSEGRGERLWSSVSAGVKYAWSRETIRLTLLIVAAVNVFFVGPVLVGIPVLAEQRLPEGAAALGLLLSAFAGGNLGGFLLAGVLPKAGRGAMRLILTVFLAGFAVALAVMGMVSSTWIDFGLLLGLGIGHGYLAIILISALQKNAPEGMLGRMMGLLMFSSMGLVPLSEAVSGAVSRNGVGVLFLVAACLMALVTVWAALQPRLSAIAEA